MCAQAGAAFDSSQVREAARELDSICDEFSNITEAGPKGKEKAASIGRRAEEKWQLLVDLMANERTRLAKKEK